MRPLLAEWLEGRGGRVARVVRDMRYKSAYDGEEYDEDDDGWCEFSDLHDNPLFLFSGLLAFIQHFLGVYSTSHRATLPLMDMKELVAFAALQESRFKTMRGLQTDSERTYAYLAKLGEEYGELCEQILALQGHQRAEKADKFGTEKLGGELADVAIVLFVIAQNLGVDLPSAIGKKVEVVNERFKHVVA